MDKTSIPWSAKQIAKMYGNTLKFNNIIQRNEVWDIKKKSTFIDSMFRGFPIPAVFTIKTDLVVKDLKGRDVKCDDCIDGKQRCTTIYQFKNNEFALAGLEPLTLEDGSDIELNGLTYEELPEELKDSFDSCSIVVYRFENITEQEIAEMMWRLNNGRPLSGVEKARIKSKDLKNIIELGKHALFNDYLSANAINSYQNEDIVIKNLIQYEYPDDPSFDAKRTREVYESHSFTDAEKKRFSSMFNKVWEILSVIEIQGSKKVFSKAKKKTNLLAILSLAELDMSADDIASKLTEFFTTEDNALSVNEEYNEASKNGTNHSANVKTRNDIIRAFVTK